MDAGVKKLCLHSFPRMFSSHNQVVFLELSRTTIALFMFENVQKDEPCSDTFLGEGEGRDAECQNDPNILEDTTVQLCLYCPELPGVMDKYLSVSLGNSLRDYKCTLVTH